MALASGDPARRVSGKGAAASTASNRLKPASNRQPAAAGASQPKGGTTPQKPALPPARGTPAGNPPSKPVTPSPRAAAAKPAAAPSGPGATVNQSQTKFVSGTAAPAPASPSRVSRIIRKGGANEPPKDTPVPPPEELETVEPLVADEEGETILDDPPEDAPEAEEITEQEAPRKKEEKTSQRVRRQEETEKIIKPAQRASERGDRISSRRIPTSSERIRRQRGKEDEEDKPDAEASKKALEHVVDAATGSGRRSARASARPSLRGKAQAQPLFTTKHKVIGGLVVVLVVFGVVSYPFIKKALLVSSLDSGNEKAAADLYEWLHADALPLFVERIRNPPSEPARQAAGRGLALAVKGGSKEAVEQAAAILKEGAGKEDRLVAAEALVDSADFFLEKKNKEGMASLVAPLGGALNAAHDPAVRLAAIKGLGKCWAPGACVLLLRVARDEKGETRARAMEGIIANAQPDAIGTLLPLMANKEDPDLAKTAQFAFAKVQDEAPSQALTPLLKDKSPDVRRTIVKALSSPRRKSDKLAIAGVAAAFGDTDPEIRIEAIGATPKMIFGYDEILRAEPLVTDPELSVRLATADAFGKLHDEGSWKLLLGSFAKGLDEKTTEAFLKAVAERGKEHTSKRDRKDVESIRILMDSLEKRPEAAKAIGSALVQLTLHPLAPRREAERSAWGAEAWKAWFANLLKRDEIEKKAMELLLSADKQKMNLDSYPKLYEMTLKGIDMLGECKKMCAPNDPEDARFYERKEEDFSKNQYQFQKFQKADMRHE